MWACKESTPASTVVPIASPTTLATPPPAETAQLKATPTQPEAEGLACGVERWAVKTLTDSDAAKVNFQAVPGSVGTLVSLPKPAALPKNSRIAPVELTVYTVKAHVEEFKLENDSDIHVVISNPDDPNETMIVEFVNTQCIDPAKAIQETAMAKTREDFIGICGEPARKFLTCEVDVEITGVGFFDFIHGQTGVSPNGIEIHPVLAIKE